VTFQVCLLLSWVLIWQLLVSVVGYFAVTCVCGRLLWQLLMSVGSYWCLWSVIWQLLFCAVVLKKAIEICNFKFSPFVLFCFFLCCVDRVVSLINFFYVFNICKLNFLLLDVSVCACVLTERLRNSVTNMITPLRTLLIKKFFNKYDYPPSNPIFGYAKCDERNSGRW
jgi:hypothetical protein